MAEEYISIRQAAVRMGVHRSTAYNRAACGNLPGLVRIVGRLMVHGATLDEWLEVERRCRVPVEDLVSLPPGLYPMKRRRSGRSPSRA